MPDFASRLKKLRVSKGISQKELGKFLNVTQNAVFNWENKKTEPPINTIEQIATYFNVAPSYLMGWEEELIIFQDTINKERKAQADAAKTAANALSEIAQAGLEGAEEHRENLLLYNYRQLNQKGQYEAVKRVQDLTYNPDYTKSTPTPSSVLVAAHNDHADDPEEQEKIQRDLDMLKKIDGQEK